MPKNIPHQFKFEILNQLRGFFCAYIVLHNIATSLYQSELVSLPIKVAFSFGQELLVGFFLISGFLSFFSFKTKYYSFAKYIYQRFKRIYIPFTVSIIVSLIVAHLTGNLVKLFTWWDLMGNLLLLQDFGSVKPGTWFYPFLGNLPLWSLSYQWWFYVLAYPIYRLLPEKNIRIYMVFLFSMISYIIYYFYPNQICLIFTYFPLEWLGLELGCLYFKYHKFTLQNTRHCLICMGGMVFVTLIPIFLTSEIKLGYYPFLMFRHFLMALVFLGISIIAFQFNWKGRVKKLLNSLNIFTKIYPISYGLYVLHYPILVKWGLRNYPGNNQIHWVDFGLSLIGLIILSYFAEIKLPKLLKLAKSRISSK